MTTDSSGHGEAAEPLSPGKASALFDAAFAGRSRILVGVSGGADSVALLVLVAEWAPPAVGVAVATVDHGLRAHSADEAEAVRNLASRYGLAHATLLAPLPVGAARIEERARDLRYAALVAHAREIGADALATAHTLDDQAETVLMRLAAGSGPAGLAGMRAAMRREGLAHLRPFLSVPKSRLVATLRARALTWAEDAMNRDDRFARPRLRAGRAILEREGLTAARLATLARRMARAEAALEQATDEAERAYLERDGLRWTIAAASRALPEEIRLRLLARALAPWAPRINLEKLERLFGRIAASPTGAATLAGVRVAWSADGRMSGAEAAPRRVASTPAPAYVAGVPEHADDDT